MIETAGTGLVVILFVVDPVVGGFAFLVRRHGTRG
jgi:hypothetical protein